VAVWPIAVQADVMHLFINLLLDAVQFFLAISHR